ncbi:MAG TPA: hypothetical protein PKC43_07435, partial [Phycisphaerales bacterium]|nr:hypothetical protein [Phycisphaerales bacterium]HMP37267.1 hypothetical protein [Phycisphaerales bacterium]
MIDPFCCDVVWDALCVNGAVDLCEDCQPSTACVDSDHDCCTVGGPGCTDTECCELTCQIAPTCCDTAWDRQCIVLATKLCIDCNNCGDADHDCATEGGPGCDDGECCELVCAAYDPWCCTVAWDAQCVFWALKSCFDWLKCGDPAAGDCAVANGTPGCDDEACCVAVCSRTPSCCTIEWDSDCVASAFPICGDTCPPAEHDCLTEGSPGCSSIDCCSAVCGIELACCIVAWDADCVAHAIAVCGVECPPSGHGCYTVGAPGCNALSCCNAVCAVDPACCIVAWDAGCVAAANDQCGPLCPPSDHACCNVGGPGCDNQECCFAVCQNLPQCCTVAWDGLCVAVAIAFYCTPEQCYPCGTSDHGCFTTGMAGCDDADCCFAVCNIWGGCCTVAWDANCVALAEANCDQPEEVLSVGGMIGTLFGGATSQGVPQGLLISGDPEVPFGIDILYGTAPAGVSSGAIYGALAGSSVTFTFTGDGGSTSVALVDDPRFPGEKCVVADLGGGCSGSFDLFVLQSVRGRASVLVGSVPNQSSGGAQIGSPPGEPRAFKLRDEWMSVGCWSLESLGGNGQSFCYEVVIDGGFTLSAGGESLVGDTLMIVVGPGDCILPPPKEEQIAVVGVSEIILATNELPPSVIFADSLTNPLDLGSDQVATVGLAVSLQPDSDPATVDADGSTLTVTAMGGTATLVGTPWTESMLVAVGFEELPPDTYSGPLFATISTTRSNSKGGLSIETPSRLLTADKEVSLCPFRQPPQPAVCRRFHSS